MTYVKHTARLLRNTLYVNMSIKQYTHFSSTFYRNRFSGNSTHPGLVRKMIFVSVFVLVLLIQCQNVFTHIKISDEDMKLLPRIYEFGRPDLCHKETERFCHLTIELSPKNRENPSKIWTIIEQTKNSTEFFSHDLLNYAVCVRSADSERWTETNLNESLERFYTKQYEHSDLVAHLLKIDCDIDDRQLFEASQYDWLILFSVLAYSSFAIFATVCDFKNVQNKFILTFSARENFRKLLKNSNAKQLNCIQGLKFYFEIYVIFCHTYSSLIITYLDNVEYFEQVPKIWWRHIIQNSLSFIVQPFIVISGWLLTCSLLKILKHQQQNKSPIKVILLTFINRCLRLLPVLILLTVILSSPWIVAFFKGPVKKIYVDVEYNKCRQNWWIHLVFLDNFFASESCSLITWYAATDTQLYLLSLIILVVIWRFNLNFVKTMLCVIFGAILLQFYMIYKANVSKLIYDFGPKSMVGVMVDQVENNLFVLYMSPVSRMSSYFIGLLFGYIYFQMEEGKIHFNISNKVHKFLWGISAVALPFASTVICGFIPGSHLMRALLAALVKPIYALGICMGILGMVKNLGGPISNTQKALCEWKPVVFLGNISYSVYLIQYIHIFNKGKVSNELVKVSDWLEFQYFIYDMIGSYFLGILTHLFVELPMSEVQNMIVPKMTKPTKKDL